MVNVYPKNFPTQQLGEHISLPDFSRLTPELFTQVLPQVLAESEARWQAIATADTPPTIANTLVAIDEALVARDAVLNAFWTLTSSVGGEKWDAAETQLQPLITAHFQTLSLDQAMYQRLTALKAQLPANADAISRLLLDLNLLGYELAGVNLPVAQREELKKLSLTQAKLETEFGQKVVAGMQQAAAEVPASGRTTFENTTAQLYTTNIADEKLRAEIFAASASRGDGHHPATDTRTLICQIAQLRATQAQLLGRTNHLDTVVAQGTVPSAQAIQELLATCGRAALTKLETEAAQLSTYGTVTAANWPYLEAQARKAQLGFDDQLLAPYLDDTKVLEDGVFYAANQLYGLDFTAVPAQNLWADSVKMYHVTNSAGQLIAVYLLDLYARAGKRGGAWMHNLVEQCNDAPQVPVICNNLNLVQPAPGEPTSCTWDQVITMFHEFGHALHGMLSRSPYRAVAGTNVPRDFVEYPSQLNEMWAYHPQVLANFARHRETGEPLAAELLEKLANSATFGQGFATLEYVAAAELDQAWHRLQPADVPTAEQALVFEQQALQAAGFAHDLVPPRYRSTFFNHTFGGGYDGSYYAYLWAEVLVADTQEWFSAQPNDGLNRAAGEKFAAEVLSRGRTRDPLASFTALLGREPDPSALLRRRGLLPAQ